MYASLDALRSDLGKPATSAAQSAYAAKMLHPVPESTSVDRADWLIARCRGRKVLEFGASGPMHEGIVAVATGVVGIDREGTLSADGRDLVLGFDLDDIAQRRLPDVPVTPDLIVCGEVLEHLANPGWFLTRLRKQYPDVPLIVTVPNAFSEIARRHIKQGTENINLDHVAWYSFTTLKTLLQRVGYAIQEQYWYNGAPYLAEGLIVVAT